MARFNPAPRDKYADDVTAARPAGPHQTAEEELDAGLKDTFPASDPVSAAQPAHATDDRRTRSADAGDAGAQTWWGS
jgi:hypothetical protein